MRCALFFLLLPLLFSFKPGNFQERHEITGVIIDTSDSLAMPMVAVGIEELDIWTVSDMEGNFRLRNIPPGRYTLKASCLGFERFEQRISVPAELEVLVAMAPTSLALDEVEVTAREGERIGSSTIIGSSAIEHVQPSDISDILQLLPGQITTNPDLSRESQLSLRDLGDPRYNPMAGLGTGLVIDGTPMLNTANLQAPSTSTVSSALGRIDTDFASTAGSGVDVRQFMVDNIESVEVVRGIPGAEEGDILSGVVRITTRKGESPLRLRTKIDPRIKQLYVGRGLSLGDNRGTLNLDFDYAQTQSDIRFPYRTYNRFSGNATYSNTVFSDTRPLSYNVSLRYSHTSDVRESDPDMLDVEDFSSKEHNVDLSLSGRWVLNSPVLTNIRYNISGRFQDQVSTDIRHRSLSRPEARPVAMEPGEFESVFLPSRYVAEARYYGKPYYFNANLSGRKVNRWGEVTNTITGGFTYRISGNDGRGRVIDMDRPPRDGSRPRPYSEIPSLSQLAMFIEEAVTLPLGATSLELEAGLRFTNVQPEGMLDSEVNTTMLDPRLNMKYNIIDNGRGRFKGLSIRGGYGIFSTAPTLLHYYPDKAYTDRVVFNYYDASLSPPHTLVVTNTDVIEDTRNYNLQPARNTKIEAGVDFKIGQVEVLLTGYMEEMDDGFAFHREYGTFIFDRYERLTRGGLFPEYLPGVGVVYNDPETGEHVNVPTRPDTTFVSHSYPENAERTVKRGIEYSIDFGRISALRTSFQVNGAYMAVQRQDMTDYLSRPSTTWEGERLQLVGLYPGGDGRLNDRFNTNIRTTTHIPQLRMVVSMTAQIIWREGRTNVYEDADGNPLVLTEKPTDDPYGDRTQRKFVYPLGFYDRAMNFHPWEDYMANQRPYSDLIDHYSNTERFIPIVAPPVFQINTRITKEISDAATLSFFVNNLTNYRPLQQERGRTEQYTRRNQSIYFGGELTITI